MTMQTLAGFATRSELGEFTAPDVVGLDNGDFIVVARESSRSVVAQRYDVLGELKGETFLAVDDETSVKLLAGLDAVDRDTWSVAWLDFATANRPDLVVTRRGEGDALDFEREMISHPGDASKIWSASVVVQNGDHFAGYAWSEALGGAPAAFATRRSLEPLSPGESFQLFDNGNPQYEPDAAVLANGDVVTVFVETSFGGAIRNVFLTVVDPANRFAPPRESVEEDVSGDAFSPKVAALTGGGFAVAYRTDENEIRAKVFDAAKRGVDQHFLVEAIAPGDRGHAIAGTPDGGFAIVWWTSDAGTGAAIRYATFDAVGTPLVSGLQLAPQQPPADGTLAAETLTDGRIAVSWVEESGGFVLTRLLDTRDGDARGGPGDDVIAGQYFKGNEIRGFDGDDELHGRGYGDLILGGDDDDLIFGGAGQDTLRGGRDADRLNGDEGLDRLFGNAGNDVLKGGDDADLLVGGGGNDVARGQSGDDIVKGGGANDVLKGNGGSDKLVGQSGDDTVKGGGANDVLKGNGGADLLQGQRGDDKLKSGGGEDVLRFKRGDGRDVVLDWTDGEDVIHIRKGANGFGRLDIREKGGHVFVEYGKPGDVIKLRKTDAEDLDASDFLFG
ncbi:MAG TPA: calcium-binding protein [Paracoccaceae bacterium]|nr:calcium-binding protein [Paracoccaceae bacterium]